MTHSEEARAVVAFSFGQRTPKDEPNPCNRRLAIAAERIIKDQSGDILLTAQWEVAERLASDGMHIDQIIGTSSHHRHLDSDEVWTQASAFLESHHISRVIPVAQPFLHMHKVRRLIRKSGIVVERKRIGWIGFDSSSANTQWWTKGPLRLSAYAIMQALARPTNAVFD